MILRPHQELAVEMLRDSLRKGNKRPILGTHVHSVRQSLRPILLVRQIKKVSESLLFVIALS